MVSDEKSDGGLNLETLSITPELARERGRMTVAEAAKATGASATR
jgi:hypothetical protein